MFLIQNYSLFGGIKLVSKSGVMASLPSRFGTLLCMTESSAFGFKIKLNIDG